MGRSAVIRPADAFDVQLAIARMTRLRVSTRQLNEYQVQYLIGFKWLFTCDEDELDQLARDVESNSQFKETFDTLKGRCLTFSEILSER